MTGLVCSGIVIAGGRSRRLGRDKRALRLWGANGPTLLEHSLAVLAPLCAELIVALNDPDAWPALPARCVADSHPDAGPLGGLCAGLAAASYPLSLVIAADLPLLNSGLLRALRDQPGDYDALVPRTTAGLQPFHAVYRQRCLAPLRAYLAGGGRTAWEFLQTIAVAHPETATLTHYDPQGHSFLNLNTEADMALISQLIPHHAEPK